MATWHQTRAGINGLYQPEKESWKVVSDRTGEFASAVCFKTKEQAIALQKRNGGVIIPPHNTGLYAIDMRYKTPSGKWSYVIDRVRGRDMGEAEGFAISRLQRDNKRKIASDIEVLSVREIL